MDHCGELTGIGASLSKQLCPWGGLSEQLQERVLLSIRSSLVRGCSEISSFP